ncbi:hypothetical protein [Thioalkalivibrio sp. ALMg9]|uniref:hypothetical protein n=1 Tax=Thioalkalivibrio sp. ALMg9 TaxID=1266912 RepID=UPI00036985C9|nr:hypothetical protein [Thioalkalivibrio sp. ALMg9]
MMPHTSTLPSALGAGNQHLLEALNKAQTVATLLAEWGCAVTRVEAAERNPVIWITRPPAHLDLPRVCKVTRVRGAGLPPERLYATHYMGCQVQWLAH